MLQRKRSASSPRDIGEVFFRAEMDFLSDVFDDSSDTRAVAQLPTVLESPAESDDHSSPTKVIAFGVESKEKNEDDEDENSTWDIAMTIIFVIASGTISSIFFELLLSVDSSASLLAALFLHIWIIMTSMNNAKEYLLSPKIPLYWHLIIVTLSFGFILFKSYALEKLSMPVFIACSNLQLAVGLFVGTVIFGKTFSRGQYIGVTAVTIGCVLAAIPRDNSSDMKNEDDLLLPPSSPVDLIRGICYIMLSLMSISIMIPLGSTLVQKYEANIQEQIFLQHLLSMPLFILRYKDLEPTLMRVITPSTSDFVFGFGIVIPCSIVFLCGTTIFANVNRHYTLELSLVTNPMISQLVNTAQKTIVLVFSMVYFHAPPYPQWFIWLGVVIQTMGSLYYMRDSFSNQHNASFTFKPNTSRSRFSMVQWDGSTIDLGLSASDVRHLRSLAKKTTRGKMCRCASDSLMGDVLEKIEDEEYNDYDDIDIHTQRSNRHTFSSSKDTVPFHEGKSDLKDIYQEVNQTKISDVNSKCNSSSSNVYASIMSSDKPEKDNNVDSLLTASLPVTRRYRSVSCDDEDATAARARRMAVSRDEYDE